MALTKRQREHLEKRLREERERVLRALGQYNTELADAEQEAAGDVSKFPTHLADEGTDTFDRELDAQEASRLSRELDEIDAALERLYHAPDSFGRDERTGADIPFERLDVIPWARTLVDPKR
jgi:DnaK suppressor protein